MAQVLNVPDSLSVVSRAAYLDYCHEAVGGRLPLCFHCGGAEGRTVWYGRGSWNGRAENVYSCDEGHGGRGGCLSVLGVGFKVTEWKVVCDGER